MSDSFDKFYYVMIGFIFGAILISIQDNEKLDVKKLKVSKRCKQYLESSDV